MLTVVVTNAEVASVTTKQVEKWKCPSMTWTLLVCSSSTNIL